MEIGCRLCGRAEGRAVCRKRGCRSRVDTKQGCKKQDNTKQAIKNKKCARRGLVKEPKGTQACTKQERVKHARMEQTCKKRVCTEVGIGLMPSTFWPPYSGPIRNRPSLPPAIELIHNLVKFEHYLGPCLLAGTIRSPGL